MGKRRSLWWVLASLLVAIALLLSLISPVLAAEQPIRLYLGSEELQADVPPQIIEGRTLVPIRVIADNLGFEVEWIATTKTVRLTGPHTVQLRLGSSQALVDGRTVTMDVPAQSVQGRTMVPLRFVAQAVGYGVAWDENERAVRLTAPRVQLGQMYLDTKVAEQVEFTVDRSEQDMTVVSGRVDPSLGWTTIGLKADLGDGYGFTFRKVPIADGAFSVSAAVPGGKPVMLYLYSDDANHPFSSFTVLHPESIRPQVLAEHGVEIVDLWTTYPTDRLSATPTPEGLLRLGATLGMDATEVTLSGVSEFTTLSLEDGQFETILPLKGPARRRICIWVEGKNRGCAIAEQTAENDLEPMIRWTGYLRFEEPLASGMTVVDSMRVAGQVKDMPHPVVQLSVRKLGAEEELISSQSLAIKDGRFDGRIWFPFGAGEYEVTVWWPLKTDPATGVTTLGGAARWSVTSTVTEELRWRIPTQGVESDAPEIIALAEEITRGRSTPEEKARAIHDWVAQNVAYDVEKFMNSTFRPDDGAVKTLATRKGVCQDYAYLTAALLRAVGIKARIASGEANGYGGWGGHAWTEAWVGDRWLTIDTTWDAGYIDGIRFHWAFKTKYYDPDPQVFAQDHRLEEYRD